MILAWTLITYFNSKIINYFEKQTARMKSSLLPVFLTLFLIGTSQSANILFYFGFSTYSHRIAVWPLVEALVDRGHNITFAQTYPPKNPHPKVTEFFPKYVQEKVNAELSFAGDFNPLLMRLESGAAGSKQFSMMLPSIGLQRCDYYLSDPETQHLLKTGNFDLVIIDGLFNDCGIGISAKFGAKTIIFGTTHPFPWIMEPFRVVPETSIYPELHCGVPIPMSFYERTVSTLVHLAVYFYKQLYLFPKTEDLLRTKLNFPEMPPLAELERKVNLFLYNSHFSEDLARSLPPFFVPVGGMHCQHPKDGTKLPKVCNLANSNNQSSTDYGEHLTKQFLFYFFTGY